MMRFALPIAIALTASCGGSTEPTPTPTPDEVSPPAPDEPAISVTVPAPWSDWELPVGAATVDSADDKELHLLYDHGKPMETFKHWTLEMKEGGWKVMEPFVFKGIYSTTFIKGPDKVEIIVGGRTDAVDVLLTIGA